MITRFAYRLEIPVRFPEGLHPGAGSQGNRIVVARDGQNRPILRGTAIAGVLRTAYGETENSAPDKWFGEKLDERNESGTSSRLIVEDAVFDTIRELPETTHNAHNRHTGAVYKSALFSEERIPANAETKLRLSVTADCESEVEEVEAFLQTLADLCNSGLFFGGAIARGMGRAEIAAEGIRWKKYDLKDAAQTAAWLDEGYALRRGDDSATSTWETFGRVGTLPLKDELTITLTLKPARGQDFLVAEGGDMTPLRRLDASGRACWVLPGSTLRGLLRAWITRLAAREGVEISDSAAKAASEGPLPYDKIAWGGEERDDWKENPNLVSDPILRLFGSFYARSRIHISDGLVPVETATVQYRKHVALDAISGGAIESLLFDNDVLIGGEFKVQITVQNPEEREVVWLIKALKALDLGLIRVGSSKASGRFEIAGLEARGNFAEKINVLKKVEG